MYQRRIFRYTFSLILAGGVLLFVPPLSAQLELKYFTPGARFGLDRRSKALLTPMGGSLQIQAVDRNPLIVAGPLQIPAGRFEIRRIVVRFRDPKNSRASLRGIELTDPQSGKLLKVDTLVQGDRSSYEMFPPSTSANAWKFPEYKPPTTVSSATVARIEIGSGINIDPDGPGPPPPNYQPPPGEPLILISVDVYVKNPNFSTATTGTTATPAIGLGPVVGVHPPAPKPAPAAPAVAVANIPDSKAVIYAITADNKLLWYRHDGREDGSFRWAATAGLPVGTGWNFRTVIGAGGGVLYAITTDGDLVWYRHDGRGGTFSWAQSQGQTINSGFKGLQVIGAGGGLLYALSRNGELRWYRHDGYADGADRWTAREGRLVVSNWHFFRIFAGDGGTLYGLTGKGDLYRF
ncbi:MAG: hypothetical protein JWQ42_4669 [Edaphobacter sp.]|nr:hypothetical protein [Edaphobacter sp.]